MENFIIEGSHDVFFVPSVNFNYETGVCELGGESYLEETVKFYEPLMKWLDTYFDEIKKPITFNISLTYFNTSSSGAILNILNKLKQYEEDGGDVIVNWYYDEEDTDMEEEIEDYTYATDLEINMIPFDQV